jgi:rubrerythrin
MKTTEEELIQLLKKQIELEGKMVDSMNQTMSKLKNVVVKQLLNGIALDSRKHQDILNAVIELLRVATAMTEVERDQLSREISDHIEVEERMLNNVKVAGDKTDNVRVKFLLQYIASDEKRHHQTLREIMDYIVSKEIITEAEWWDALYRDAVAHGAPGG